jgi:hypothetical protein
MNVGSTWQRLRSSIGNSAGTIVFGMEDGTVSIFGLVFGVAATTNSTKTVLIAGAAGAVAVSRWPAPISTRRRRATDARFGDSIGQEKIAGLA